MSFDADSYVESHETWTLKIGGIEYRSRPVSVNSVIAFQWGLEGKFGKPTEKERRVITAEVLRRAFPKRLSRWWRRDPVEEFFKLSAATQKAVLDDFFGPLARRHAQQMAAR